MKLDVIDTIMSGFDRIASKATLGVIGVMIALLILLGGGFAIGGFLMTVSTILGGAVMAITFIGYILGAASLGVGMFRAFDQKDFKTEMFTENIIWPFLRLTGANITIQSFALAITYILVYPIMLIGLLGGSAASLTAATGTSNFTGMGAGLIAGLGLAGLISLGIILYLLATLILSVPRITVDDKRLFQALDESVQTTKGNRIRIIATLVPIVVLMAAGIGSLVALGGLIGMILYLILVIATSFYMPAILTELNSRFE